MSKLENVVGLNSKSDDLSIITKKYFHRWKHTTINGGYCFLWAWAAKKHFPQSQLCQFDQCHAFVKIGDLYFDSESPLGVPDWKSLKTFSRKCAEYKCLSNTYKSYMENISIDNFLQEWKYSLYIQKIYKKSIEIGFRDAINSIISDQ